MYYVGYLFEVSLYVTVLGLLLSLAFQYNYLVCRNPAFCSCDFLLFHMGTKKKIHFRICSDCMIHLNTWMGKYMSCCFECNIFHYTLGLLKNKEKWINNPNYVILINSWDLVYMWILHKIAPLSLNIIPWLMTNSFWNNKRPPTKETIANGVIIFLKQDLATHVKHRKICSQNML